MIVPADILWLALRGKQLSVDLLFVVGKVLRDLLELLRDLLVRRLRGQRLCPIEREVEVAAPIIDLSDLSGRRLVALEELGVGLVQRISQNLGHRVVSRFRQVFQGSSQCEELTERIPSQVAFLLELLHMLRRRSSRAGLE